MGNANILPSVSPTLPTDGPLRASAGYLVFGSQLEMRRTQAPISKAIQTIASEQVQALLPVIQPRPIKVIARLERKP